jgi:NAD(P)-dependent dehydrogenase (short-subunit alcohol dehydrogenase family)
MMESIDPTGFRDTVRGWPSGRRRRNGSLTRFKEMESMKKRKVVLVTGASRGIGAAAALWLAQTGAAVSIMARSADGLNGVAGQIEANGGTAQALPGDVADADACRRAVARTLDRFGRLDALVNNAGILAPLAFTAKTDASAWRYNLDVNVMGPVYLAQAAMDALRGACGRIVNVSSGASQMVIAAAGAYCTAKAALNHFTRVLAAEEPRIVSVAIRPGVVDTAMQETLRARGPEVMPAEQAGYYLSLWRKGELAPPAVPGRAVAWLALFAPAAMSGEFVNFDDHRIAGPAAAVFGDFPFSAPRSTDSSGD